MTCVLSSNCCQNFPTMDFGSSNLYFPPIPASLMKFQTADGSVDYFSFFSSITDDPIKMQVFQGLPFLQQLQQIGYLPFYPNFVPFELIQNFKGQENKENYEKDPKKEENTADSCPMDLSNANRKRKPDENVDSQQKCRRSFSPARKLRKKDSSPCGMIQPVLENLSILQSSPSTSSPPLSPPLPARSPGALPNHRWPKPGWDDEIINQIERRRARKYIETCLKQFKKHFNKGFRYRSRNTDDLRVQLMKHRCMTEIFEALEFFVKVDKIREARRISETRKTERCVSR